MAFPPENLKIWVNSREIHAFIQTATYPLFTKGTHGPKRATTGSKRPKNACWSIPSGLGTTLEKIFFFRPGDPGGPTVGPHCGWAGRPSGCTK